MKTTGKAATRGRPIGSLKGLDAVSDAEGMTLREVAKVIGVTAEGARQIEARALRKVAVVLAERGLSLKDLVGD